LQPCGRVCVASCVCGRVGRGWGGDCCGRRGWFDGRSRHYNSQMVAVVREREAARAAHSASEEARRSAA
jgi:hypothetical protein